ncbi:hypothetical protein C8J57DRAFT_1268484 [Mycena rebaudengoi]|nr:hypothetical protein C8J57DRAFT_1268484 [Mycena rebaudengoi]
MHQLRSQHYSVSESSNSRYPRYAADPSLTQVVASASTLLDQPPPPSLRDILGAYKANGDGDRDMLLAMLNAKTAEDQRQASIATLHRTMLEVYQFSAPHMDGGHHYPTPKFTQSPPLREARPMRTVYHEVSSVSRSPPRARGPFPSMREAHSPKAEHRRKRSRRSYSPPPPPPPQGESTRDSHSSRHETVRDSHSAPRQDSHSEQLPPSPYSSSGSSMTIGSLLSTGPNREGSGEPPA